MPELPEVEVVRIGSWGFLRGGLLGDVSVFDARSLRRHRGDAASFVTELEGARPLEPGRRGKFLWFPLAVDASGDAAQPRNRALLVHLGMSGRLQVSEPVALEAPPRRHERVRMQVRGGARGDVTLAFYDQRLFGSLAVDELVDDGLGGIVASQAAHIALDVLDSRLDLDALGARMAESRSAIKRVLLNQNVVSGIGNIYADEGLWRARVHPLTPASALGVTGCATVLRAVAAMMRLAIAQGGTSFDEQYRNVNGQAGYFAVHLNAYGRTGQPCPRCGAPIVREAFMNRSSHFCPVCQVLR